MASASQSADRPSAPLAGVRVAEFSGELSVPYAGKLLSDLGATVLKFEDAEGGDPSRRDGPFGTSASEDESSGMFAYLNTGKRSITRQALDAGDGGVTLADLLRWADIALVDRPSLHGEPELRPARVAEQAPQLILVTVTPYGTTGPYAEWPATDLTISAVSGMSVSVGERDRAPLALPFSQCDINGGLFAALAAMTAYVAAQRDGQGQHVDLSTADIMAGMFTGYFLPRFIYGGGLVGVRAGRDSAAMPYPGTVFRCADGLIRTDTPQVAQWIRLVELMGTPEWSKEPRYRNRRAMQWEYKQEVDALVEPWFMARTKEELGKLFLEHRLPYAPLLTAEDMERDPHLAARASLVTLPALDGEGGFVAPAAPYRFSGERPASRPAPALGSSDDELAALVTPHRERDLSAPHDGSTTSAPPLQGIRVIDLGTAWAGGLAGRLLADYGADVLKIESWVHMDGSRLGKPIVVEDDTGGDEGKWPDLQPGFHVHSRNKRSVTLNLKTEAGRSALLRLVREADALIHNFPAGVMDRLGLSEDQLHAENERLVVVGQNVAGAEGPKSGLIGYAGAVAALSGLVGWVGYEGEDPIGMFEGLYGDVVSATTTAFATLVALLDRDLHGRTDASVDVSQWEASLALAGEGLIVQSLVGQTPVSLGTRHPHYFPHGNFACAGDDQWVAVAVRSPEEWRALCRVVGREDLTTPLETVDARRQRGDEVTEAIEAWSRSLSPEEASHALVAAGIPAAPVLNIADIFGNEHFRARDLFIDVEHPLVGSEPMTGVPWKMSRTPGRVSRRAPLLGEHTEEVLRGMAGVSDEEYRELVDAGGIETGPPEGRT